jgi:hypothetical protein
MHEIYDSDNVFGVVESGWKDCFLYSSRTGDQGYYSMTELGGGKDQR